MKDSERTIGIVGTFYKTAGKRLTLDSITVLTESVSRHDGKTYRGRDGYDVDWSREYGYIFHNSSGGGEKTVEVSGIYFASGDVKIKEKPAEFVDVHDKPPWKGKKTLAIRKRNKTRRLAKLPKAFDMTGVSDLLAWLQYNGIEADAVYCSTCHDYFPGTDDWNLCEHCWWCSKTGWYSTPNERCKCKDREECDGE
jgi:hypothetical protein